MSDINIRVQGAAGRITLTRPQALNALSLDMVHAITAALDTWRKDAGIALVIIDAQGDKAFCAGGDIQQIYQAGRTGDFSVGRQFWRDEYRMNLAIATYPKPVVALMHGLVLGGGVGLGCHASHRIVCETAKLALTETAVGLVADVGSSWLLARAPGHTGAYLGTCAARMGPGDAIVAGFADYFVHSNHWPQVVSALETTGTLAALAKRAQVPPPAPLMADRGWIDMAFSAPTLAGIVARLSTIEHPAAERALAALHRNSPLAMACTLALTQALRADPVGDVAHALTQEYRFVHRAMERGDFLEGVRAAVIDKDRSPVWRNGSPTEVLAQDVSEILAPLGEDELQLM